MRQVALGGIFGSLGLSLLVASGCGGSAFSASSDTGGESNGGSGVSGMTDIGGMTSSGGKSGGGGTTSSGGSTGSAGSGGSAGGGSCVTGMLTFKMVPAKGSGSAAFCSGCVANWLTVTDSNGQAVTLDRSCSVADCSTCTPSACPPVACLNQSVPAEGLSRSWDETHWVDSSCGASALACAGAHCVAPGKYKAKMCAAKNTTPNGNFCTPDGSPVCTEVDFVLPGLTTVQGIIGG